MLDERILYNQWIGALLRCPECGAWMGDDGRCENQDCDYHWHPLRLDEMIREEMEYEP
ncbi:MAG: hypothetical protein PHY23_04355 [Oscillospiraceae bacterium]|jgi:hypothetical protein|nr:hypothetical protein [Oscillospiraceae bacterium]